MTVTEALSKLALNPKDEKVWSFLYQYFWPYVYSIVYRMLGGTRDQAEDGAQETFLRVLKQSSMFELVTEDSFRAYLGTVARNVAIDKLRLQKREPGIGVGQQALIAKPENREMVMRFSEEIDDLLSGLPDIDKRIVGLLLQGYSLRDIGDELKLTENNIGVRLYRIRKRLRPRWEAGVNRA